MTRLAIIAALDREIHPLVESWARTTLRRGGKVLSCYQNHDVVAVAGGIGSRAAELAARAAAVEFEPQTLVSAGLGGALIGTLRVARVFIPSVIVDAATKAEYRPNANAAPAGGVLVTSAQIATRGSKQQLADRFHALVVDMEAAAVARVAQELKLGFFCVKAISDELESRLPPLNQFVGEEGQFATGRFVAWSAVRPHWWQATLRLASDSRRASRALCAWLSENLIVSSGSGAVVTLDRASSTKT